jgi:hypothetical protein
VPDFLADLANNPDISTLREYRHFYLALTGRAVRVRAGFGRAVLAVCA